MKSSLSGRCTPRPSNIQWKNPPTTPRSGCFARVGVLEDDDVAPIRVAEVVRHLQHQHAVARHERRLHRSRRDEERLHQEGLDQQREHERHDDQPWKLPDELHERVPVLLGGSSGRPSRARAPRAVSRSVVFTGQGYREGALRRSPPSICNETSTALKLAQISSPTRSPMRVTDPPVTSAVSAGRVSMRTRARSPSIAISRDPATEDVARRPFGLAPHAARRRWA